MVVGDRKLSLPVSAALDPSGHERSGSFCDGTLHVLCAHVADWLPLWSLIMLRSVESYHFDADFYAAGPPPFFAFCL